MISNSNLTLLSCFEIVMCLAALGSILFRKQWSEFSSLAVLLSVRATSDMILLCLWRVPSTFLSAHMAYKTYFYVYWMTYAVESILALIIIYGVFRLAMAPLKGLQTLGMLIFRWAAAISVAVALGSAFAPHLSTNKFLIEAVYQLQRTQSILTLCLLVFVCFAIRPMGLTYFSRIFGVSLGLGILSTTNLVQSAWLGHNTTSHTLFNFINGVAICITLCVWTAYFALPEPKRRIIVLPTTSPLLRWNQISLALGDNPGFVAVGGVHPELFADAELEVFRRASRKMVPTPFPKAMGTSKSAIADVARSSVSA